CCAILFATQFLKRIEHEFSFFRLHFDAPRAVYFPVREVGERHVSVHHASAAKERRLRGPERPGSREPSHCSDIAANILREVNNMRGIGIEPVSNGLFWGIHRCNARRLGGPLVKFKMYGKYPAIFRDTLAHRSD